MKDWKLIFNTKGYHYILVHDENKEKYLDFFFKHQAEIENNPSFYFMMPSRDDLKNLSHEHYVRRFAPLLKSFMENTEKTTLFIEEDVMTSIVKEDKRNNFFRYLTKNNKNIVLFYYSNLGQYAKEVGKDFVWIDMNPEILERQYTLLEKFIDIKASVQENFNPFKDPVSAFQNRHLSKEES